MENIWIIGAGTIAKEYAKVLSALHKEYIVIGRSKESAERFENETGHSVERGGLSAFLENIPDQSLPSHVIVAVDVTQLADITAELIKRNISYILTEKPGFAEVSELDKFNSLLGNSKSKVFLAYNRRFYASVIAAEKIIKEDGGLLSFHFEFTEWEKSVLSDPRDRKVLDNWFYANSTHVVDLAFYLGGFPKRISSYTSGKIDWYKHSTFVGAGETVNGILFSYCANWYAPGRWAVELMTSKHRIYLKPMEKLQIQKLNSVTVESVEIDDRLDKEFKPGFYLQTKSFIENKFSRFCTLEQQISHTINWYSFINE